MATLFNNMAASVELVGTFTIGIVTLLGVVFFFDHAQGPSILFQVHAANGQPFSLTNLGLAALLPVFTLIGWEGSADLDEETKDPRS